jgi:RHS repeat-associated protein
MNLEHGMLEFTFSYDALGRRTSLTYPNGVTTTYSYDRASRLLSLKHLNALNIEFEVLNYLYDRNGNRIAMDRLNVTPKLPTPVVSATYNEANQMLSFQPEGDVEWQMTYDENGNLTSITNSCGTTTYTWDARNRLVGIEGFDENCNPLSASFKYDALGRRIEKTINGRTIEYLYDGLDIVQEIEDGMVTVNYIRTLNIDEPLARITSDGTIRYYHADALGSIIALTDDLGNVRTQYNYSPFGETEILREPSDNPFQYTGRENDGTGLYYYRARYYSPRLKRFISEDPILRPFYPQRFIRDENTLTILWLMKDLVHDPAQFHFYVYVVNNAINLVDPLGLQRRTPSIPGYWKYLRKIAPRVFCKMLYQRCKYAEQQNEECREILGEDCWYIDPDTYKWLSWCKKMGYLKKN